MLLKGLRLIVTTIYGSSPDTQKYEAACCIFGISYMVLDRQDDVIAIEDYILLAYALCYVMHGAPHDQSMTEQRLPQSAFNLTVQHQQQSWVCSL